MPKLRYLIMHFQFFDTYSLDFGFNNQSNSQSTKQLTRLTDSQ